MIKALFAPDFRQGIAYQQLLADALRAHDVEVVFLSHYRLYLPLARGAADLPSDLLHLHWPEAYYRSDGRWGLLRRGRFRLDLALALRDRPLVYTAHNLLPHREGKLWLVRGNQKAVVRRAAAIFVHAPDAVEQLVSAYGVDRRRCHFIPLGDLSGACGQPVSRHQARADLGLDDEPICLMFGRVDRYKGIEQTLRFWIERRPPAKLFVVGVPDNPEYARRLEVLARGQDAVELRLAWQSDEQLGRWLSAADCALFNYQSILSSGAAPLARAWGLPILLPHRLKSVYLDEPHPSVFRFHDFQGDFVDRLREALSRGRDDKAAADWRERTSWATVAKTTAEVYRRVLEARA